MPIPSRLRRWSRRWLIVVLAVSLVSGLTALELQARPDPQRAAGAMTVNNRTSASFEQPAGGLHALELARHARADLLFDRTHVPLDGSAEAGLGPRFVATSCIACHVRNGRGRAIPEESLVRLTPEAGLGPQVQDKAVLGAQPEAAVTIHWRRVRQGQAELREPAVALVRPDGAAVAPSLARSLRVAPPLLGLGLLEAVPEGEIVALEDPLDADGDGISGRAHWITDPAGQRRLGRFGWKAITATVRQQSAAAYQEDMGLTTPVSLDSDRDAAGRPADIGNQELSLVTYYSQTLGGPRTALPSGNPLVQRGRRLFEQLHCSGCHVPDLGTGPAPDAVVQALRNQTIWPYTDLLLHDMGPGLADGVAERGAEAEEWRTAPLWGLGLTRRVNPQATFLHDGRARSVEEAILWHGGEAEASRLAYGALAHKEREALLLWLHQL
ncbi:MAG: di-heme oxidoredictase family protein [Synechococcus sp.]